ncbi:MAG: SIMPL domain-containing protein [Candidatus Eremiobacteraeota bacterium]|nr:SIMPL domain-containing protein [Candidatus Eremiobacteraeota bacterium]MBV8374922.1 SIMPL domain-containing protein [Candidatus Eremiobacteraeota bacterium]
MKILALAGLVVFACAPVVISAQQVQANPPGITVVATGTALVKDWVEELDLRFVPPVDSGKTAITACTAAVAQLNREMQTMGLRDAVLSSAVQYEAGAGLRSGPVTVARLHVPVERVEPVLSQLSKSDWREPGSPKLVPRDQEAANAQAYAAAVADARSRAGAIAAADGRRLGRLLSVQPLPLDFFSALAGQFATMAMNRNSANVSIPEVHETASFTFELLP